MDAKPMRLLPLSVIKVTAPRTRFMGHLQRLRILEFLDINGPQTVSAITEAVGGPQVIVSQSLAKLKADKAVTAKRDGRFIHYAIMPEYPGKLFQCLRRGYARQYGLPEPSDFDPKTKLSDDFLEMVADKIALIGHETRMQILDYIYVKGPASVSDLMEYVKASQVSVSCHLKKMRDEGLVKSVRNGRFIYYDIHVELPRTIIGCMHRNHKA